MSSVLSTIVFVKSVSGSNILNGMATSRLDNDDFLDFTFRLNLLDQNGMKELI
ncbi:10055_t:CDS:2 [Entrophospora sp. SA101]|nr:10055_t:CDS:2 [Entrophospora sp. SA101]